MEEMVPELIQPSVVVLSFTVEQRLVANVTTPGINNLKAARWQHHGFVSHPCIQEKIGDVLHSRFEEAESL